MTLKQRAFNNLTAKQRQVWTLVMQDFMTEEATGRLLGISRDAVHNRIIKARARFVNYIKRVCLR